MPPNLGGFFMVRSYYPSECHADYFDFERIEALKPAIEACGISTLSQSPMLGFHKQMDNRIKLLRSEERRVGKECRARWTPEHCNKKVQAADPGHVWPVHDRMRRAAPAQHTPQPQHPTRVRTSQPHT